jgi:3-oxoacyl-(acyl-carrier-protein) synthase
MLERTHAGVTVASPVRRVPAAGREQVPKHPRLRRASPLARFAAAAAAEALGPERTAAVAAGRLRLGVVFTLMNGCVNYSNRFYGEVLDDPLLASPILFPETVFNAPASHLSALFGSTGPNDTLLGDGAGFFPALELAADWLVRGEVDGCLVVAAEELDWLSTEALRLYSRGYIAAEGAAALYLEAGGGSAVALLAVPDPVVLTNPGDRAAALGRWRAALGAADDGHTLLVDGCVGVPRWDRAERRAWTDWTGPRWSPRALLGEALGAAAAQQAVAAVEAVRRGLAGRAIACAAGGNQQAAGVMVGRHAG